jgi:hypothetical protein
MFPVLLSSWQVQPRLRPVKKLPCNSTSCVRDRVCLLFPGSPSRLKCLTTLSTKFLSRLGHVAVCWLRHYATMGGCWFEIWWGEWMFSIYLILPATLGPGVYSASNRNEYEKQKKKMFWGSRTQPVQRAGWQPCHHLRADGLHNVGSSTSHNPIGLHGFLQG